MEPILSLYSFFVHLIDINGLDTYIKTINISIICVLSAKCRILLKNTGINKLTSISEKAAKAYLKGKYNKDKNKNRKNKINNKNIKEVNNG